MAQLTLYALLLGALGSAPWGDDLSTSGGSTSTSSSEPRAANDPLGEERERTETRSSASEAAPDEPESAMPSINVGLLGTLGDGALHARFWGASAFFGLETFLPLRLSLAHVRSEDLFGTVAGSGTTSSLTVGRFDVSLPTLSPHPQVRLAVALRMEAGALQWGAGGHVAGSQPWVALGPVARGRYALGGRFFVEAEAAAALALLRPRLLVGGAPAGEISLLSYWIGAGVGLFLQ